MKKYFVICLISLIPVLLGGCLSLKSVNRTFVQPENVKEYAGSAESGEKAASLKAHMRNGDTYVYREFVIDTLQNIIRGEATVYNYFREQVSTGKMETKLDSVVILESNVIKPSNRLFAQKLMAVVTMGIAAICITQPKACFGSCPTFYIPDGDSEHPVAEGFSSSIAPSLEMTDVDHLYLNRPGSSQFVLEMRNEALETHMVNSVNMLAVRKGKNERVFHNPDGSFYKTLAPLKLCSAFGPEGNIYEKISGADNIERFSAADSHYLAEKETLEVEFEPGKMKTPGLILGCRQTLLSTYLLYQVLAYMGNEAGFWLANLERNKLGKEQNSLLDLMGGIDIYQENLQGKWVKTGSVYQHGPLASDYYIVPLRTFYSPGAKIRLVMSKGNWRLDYCGLAEIIASPSPRRIFPHLVTNHGTADNEALALLLDNSKKLVTLPGDSYALHYTLPDNVNDYEFFLESRGYYLEWMRKEWLAEENQKLLLQTFANPTAALKRLAPDYKRQENEMEEVFWRSKYAKP